MTLTGKVLFVAWRSPQTSTIHPVGRLLATTHGGVSGWEFAYIHGTEKAGHEGFTPFPDFPDLATVYTSTELPPLFRNRVMAPSRADFDEHVRNLGLPADAREPVAILARSAGLRPTDEIEVSGLPSFDTHHQRFEYVFFLRGVRHIGGAEERIRHLQAGDELLLRPDPRNPHDPLAVAVDARTAEPVGYVPHSLVEDLELLRRRGSRLRALVERINAHPAPVHERLLVRLTASHVEGFVPFNSQRYLPLAGTAEKLQITTAGLAA
jgi:hypothetical protein